MATKNIDKLFQKENTTTIVPEVFKYRINQTLESLLDMSLLQTPPKKSRNKIWISAAAILLISGMVFASQPVMADWIKSLFSSSPTSDAGLKRSMQQGFVQHPNVQVEDQGIRLSVPEAVVDSARLVLAVDATDRSGKSLVDEVDWDQLKVQDEQGNVVAKRANFDYKGNVVTFVFPRKLATDTLLVTGDFTEIGGLAEPKVQGSWHMRFSLDLAGADKQTESTTLHQNFTTPQGFKIQLNAITKTPSTVRLDSTTSKDQKEAHRKEFFEEQKLMFHFEDKHGKPVSYVNPQKLPATIHLLAEDSYID